VERGIGNAGSRQAKWRLCQVELCSGLAELCEAMSGQGGVSFSHVRVGWRKVRWSFGKVPTCDVTVRRGVVQ